MTAARASRVSTAGLIYIGIDPGAAGAIVCLSDDADPLLLLKPKASALDSGGGPPKDRSLAMARCLWPHLTLTKNDDGLADALHLARWCRLQQQAPSPPEPDARSTVSRVLRSDEPARRCSGTRGKG